MVSEDRARIVLASWIHGDAYEDIKVIPANIFPDPYDKIAKDLRKGSNEVDLIRAHGVRLVTGILGEYMPTVYKAIVSEILQTEMYRTIPENATPKQLAEHAAKFARYWQDAPKAVNIMLSPFRSKCSLSQSAKGIVAAEVLPKCSMFTMTCSIGNSRRLATASMIRILA